MTSGSLPSSGSAQSGSDLPSSGSGSGAATGGSASGSASGGSASGSASGSATSGSAGGPDPYAGPFKVLVLSLTKGFHHDSIPAAHKLLRELGQCIDAASCALTHDEFITAAKPNSGFTIKIAGAPANCDLPAETTPGCDGNTVTAMNEFTEANLKNYQMVFFANPTGDDFSSTGAPGQAAMTGFQKFMEGGGGYGGVHSATDFEQSNGFPFYTDVMTGAQFNTHNGDGTPGNVVIQPQYLNHPVVRGLQPNWATVDEWYCMRKDINSLPGFTVLAKLNAVTAPTGCTVPGENRATIWIKEFPAMDAAGLMKGRVFYTIQGHNIMRYTEPLFRKLVHQGILWATHRLEQ
jgi:type 1 glutamine amidotransferase